MPDEVVDGAAGEVAGGGNAVPAQAPASEVTPQSVPQSWRVGDTSYDNPAKMAEAFQKFHGDYTRKSQEYAKLKGDSEMPMVLWDTVRGNPELKRLVLENMRQGDSPGEAVKKATDELQSDPRFDEMWQELQVSKQERSAEKFNSEHPDLTDEDAEGVRKWLEDNDWVGDLIATKKLSHDKALELAYSSVVSGKSAKLIEQGQRMKEQEIKKGRSATPVPSGAPTSGASQKAKKSPLHMTPAEREAYAMQVYEQSAGKR